ncbi:T9SS type A sorting domain-containing protein [Subsaximicrobium wynnwilliamsii]|uniref:T9SS type A sorting domain-containing protein n=1 Tax=Subsaximicrobium wynnwilliamsii TaxID=291179 RepID=A0A5C6ZQB6_9FLAO|nr:T9SS type A sorting domain-containing protein [Subsaximicrobium wynnwilliamsii]TXD85500.1 T9SS type A sorting domain-containing protein [Subsaximicrobium wynnwilliamsii]TXD90853.1 T9SS type A sorting domain-containing protein [Subsaximicrobium wynnwilliamsii]TXE05360.1 T9SS type A sorting domain-containing protein [Subsaximicrobium wynnwilliamsii]
MQKKDLIYAILLLFSCTAIAQENLLCPLLVDVVKIQQPAYIPIITNNTDGTVALSFPDQAITTIFAAYSIYDFYQSYPNSNPDGELFKYYSIAHDNKNLITELDTNVASDIFTFDLSYSTTPISANLIDLLDGKTYELMQYCNNSTESGENCENSTYNVPEGFELQIDFGYDSENDMITAATSSLSPCGNAFAIGMKGGFDDSSAALDNTLQLWTTTEGTSSASESSDPCFQIELMLYSMLDIGCIAYNYGNLSVNQNDENGQVILERENGTFSTDYMIFEEANLSVATETFSKMTPFQAEGNPYLQIRNAENQALNIEIFDLSGKRVLAETGFENDKINLSTYTNGLYFIKLSNLNNAQKVFKFLKN